MGNLVEPIFIKEFLPKQILNLIYTYSIIKYGNQKQFKTDIQTNALISEHSDYLMETLMDLSTPVIEQNVKKNYFQLILFLESMIKDLI
jgi:hypothetical protein